MWKSHIVYLLMRFPAFNDFNKAKNSTVPLKDKDTKPCSGDRKKKKKKKQGSTFDSALIWVALFFAVWYLAGTEALCSFVRMASFYEGIWL